MPSYLKLFPSLCNEKEHSGGASSVTNADRIALFHEIRAFDHNNLRKQKVYFLGRSLYATQKPPYSKPFSPPCHGSIIIGNLPTKNFKGHAKALSFTISPMHVLFHVSDELYNKALQSNAISIEAKTALQKFRNQIFPSTEHFLRILWAAKNQPESASDSQVIVKKIACLNMTSIEDRLGKNPLLEETDPESREALEFTRLNSKINKNVGGYIPCSYLTNFSLTDQILFEAGVANLRELPNIDPEILCDIFSEQIMFLRYIEEKAGIGQAISTPERPSTEMAKRYLNLIPKFSLLPAWNNQFSVNCNTVVASVLQLAENASAEQHHRKPQTIHGLPLFSYGSSHRMFLWEPLNKHGLRQRLFRLLDSDENFDDLDTQFFANHKKNILHLITTLPLIKQKSALEKIIDPNTRLGQIFSTQPGYTSFFSCCKSRKRNSAELQKASALLEKVNKSIQSPSNAPS